MIIERAIAAYLVYSGDPLLRALDKITANKSRIVFCVDERGHLQGALSDGDFRRWIAGQPGADLSQPVLTAANRSVTTAPSSATPEQIAALFGPGRDLIPLLDDHGRLVAVALNQAETVRIGRHQIGPDDPVLVIAEIGNNHNGSIDTAKRLVDAAIAAGADLVKFQLRDLGALYRGGATVGHDEDLGPQYTLDLLTRFSLPAPDLLEVFAHARAGGIEVICTPWDLPSLRILIEARVAALKFASADLTNHPLLTAACGHGIPLVISTGMSTEAEIRESVELVRRTGTAYALLHCQSTYPAPFKDLNLRYLPRLAELGRCPVGYSGHERGAHVPLAAVALGARIIEKHLTLDRTQEGNDHQVSLLPGELAELVGQIRDIEAALGSTAPREISTGEAMNRVNLAKSLVATRALTPGEVLTEADIAVFSPGRGVQPNALPQLIGRTINRPVALGEFFYATDLTDTVARGRPFRFRRPWGLPVRYHDWRALVADVTPDFVEFHFSYADLDRSDAQLAEVFSHLDEKAPFGYTCHLPDLFRGDFILDLASVDPQHWERSIAELQRTIDVTRSLRRWFTSPTDPILVATLGGHTTNGHLPAGARAAGYARVAQGLARLDTNGVRLTAQTLPPYPWLMGGQQFHNLFLDARDTAEFAAQTGLRLTLDVSHTKLAATWAGASFAEWVELLAPHTEHLHLVDATGVDGEGVQVGDGEVDWPVLAEQLDRLAPQAGFIPEIWQGHVNNGAGFWTALDRLERWF